MPAVPQAGRNPRKKGATSCTPSFPPPFPRTARNIWAASSSATAGSTRSSAPASATTSLSCSSPPRKGRTGGLTANGSPPMSSPSRTVPSSTGTPIRSFARISPAAKPCTSPSCRRMPSAPRRRPRRIRSAASGKAGARPSGRNTRRNGPRATSSPSCARMRATS